MLPTKEAWFLPGGSEYNQFMKIFNKVLHGDEEYFYVLRVKTGYLGSYSACKGYGTISAYGYTVYTSI